MDPEELQEVIFETWLYKHQGLDGRHTLRLSSGWKKRYIILLRHGNHATVLYYEKKPDSLEDTPKGRVDLNSWFVVKKRPQYRGRKNVCEVITATKQILLLSTEEEKMYHLLAFFLQTQIRLREEEEAGCFVVRPDGSDDHMKLGSRGSICLLHVSQGGITLALQLSRCVLTQWPLSCIKLYDGEVRGQFMIETGNNSPTGRGKYIFNTRLDQNKAIYDRLDQYVMELASLKQLAMQRNSTQAEALENVITQQYDVLQRVVQAESDPRFILHLKKVSRGIYDQLAEHLGATSHSRLDVSMSDPSTSGPPLMKFVPKSRSASQHCPPKSESLPSEEFSSMSLGRPPHKHPNQLPLGHQPMPALHHQDPLSEQVAQQSQPRSGHIRRSTPKQDTNSSEYLHMKPLTGGSTAERLLNEDCYIAADNQSVMYYNSTPHQAVDEVKGQVTGVQAREMARCEYTNMSAGVPRQDAMYVDPDPRRLTFDGYSLASSTLDESGLDDHSKLDGRPMDTSSFVSSSPEKQMNERPVLKANPEEHVHAVYQDMSRSPSKAQMATHTTANQHHNDSSWRRSQLERQLSHSCEDLNTLYAKMSGQPNTSLVAGSTQNKGLTSVYGNQEVILQHQLSRSCENLNTECKATSTKSPAYVNRNMINTFSTEQVSPEQIKPLQRCNSRSCENIAEYSQLQSGGNGQQHVTTFTHSPEPSDQAYTYMATTDVDDDNKIAYSQMLRDKTALYTKAMPKEFRRSQSLSSLLAAGEITPPSTSTLNGSEHTNKSSKRPPKFDFSNQSSSSSTSSREQPTQSSPLSSGSVGYTQVGKSKFWNVALDESPSKIVCSTAMKGINITTETRVFSRRVSHDSQASESSDMMTAGSVEFRRSDLSSNSMRGRRLPSLPADAHVTVPGLNAKDTVC